MSHRPPSRCSVTAMSERRVALVTGASSGIGAATVRALAAAGFEVVGAARRLERLEEIAGEVGGRALRLDVTDPDSVAELAEALPELSVLVNNAGGALGLEPVAEADERELARHVRDQRHGRDAGDQGADARAGAKRGRPHRRDGLSRRGRGVPERRRLHRRETRRSRPRRRPFGWSFSANRSASGGRAGPGGDRVLPGPLRRGPSEGRCRLPGGHAPDRRGRGRRDRLCRDQAPARRHRLPRDQAADQATARDVHRR